MLTSYHVHSTHSDGKNSILELAHAAVDAGLDELGISDHLVHIPGQEVSWSMPLAGLESYFNDIRTAADAVEDKVTIRYGLECDYIPESTNDLDDILQQHKLDYVIGSVHFVDGFPIDESTDHWEALSPTDRNDMIRAYWARIREMAKSGLFDFAAHLDLYKKFGHKPTIDVSRDIEAALDAIAESGMAAEINTAGWFTPGGEVYPSKEILIECHKRGIPILINADAHVTEDLTRGYAEARKLATQIGYDKITVYKDRVWQQISIR